MTAPPHDPPAPDLPGALWRDDRFAYLDTARTVAIDAAGVPRVWAGGRWADVSGTPWAEAVYRAAWAVERERARACEDALRATTSAHDVASSAPVPTTTATSEVVDPPASPPAPPPWRGDVRYLGQVDGRWSLLAWSDVLGRHVAREWSEADQWWRLAGEHRREAIYDAAFSHECAQAEQTRRERNAFQRACGCFDGETLSDTLAEIKHTLRDGERLPSPIETIADLATRVVKERNDAIRERDAARAAIVQTQAFMAMGDTWPTTDVLRKLVEAAEHLQREHDCDAHGWEEVEQAARIGRERLEAMSLTVPRRLGCDS